VLSRVTEFYHKKWHSQSLLRQVASCLGRRGGASGFPGALAGGSRDGAAPYHPRCGGPLPRYVLGCQPGHAVDGHHVLYELVAEGETRGRTAPDDTKYLI